jgi:hypothetical protein
MNKYQKLKTYNKNTIGISISSAYKRVNVDSIHVILSPIQMILLGNIRITPLEYTFMNTIVIKVPEMYYQITDKKKTTNNHIITNIFTYQYY